MTSMHHMTDTSLLRHSWYRVALATTQPLQPESDHEDVTPVHMRLHDSKC